MKHKALSFAFACALISPSSFATGQSAETVEGLLSTDRVGAKKFIKSHPNWDGQGVVIAVMDTGVDMGALGLKTLPNGKPKVIVTRDFSGQGTISLETVTPTTEDGKTVLRNDSGALTGFGRDGWAGGEYKMGWIEESRYINGGVTDLNGDGQKGDRFGVVTYSQEGEPARVLIDLDGDKDLSDEPVLGSYDETLKSFTFRGFDPQKATSPLNFSLYVLAGADELELHFDDGGHGSHVAGIAAGYGVHGNKKLNGIAPGAEVMSLKIGNNALAGGATTTGSKKKAMEFAAEWAKKNNRVVVLNLSYGIGSEIEGHSDIDLLVTQLLAEHPEHLFMSTSAGNAGPSLSNVGQPAGSTLAFSAAAALTKENAKVLFGSNMGKDRVFSFSSRGGELVKPDALLPGVASSTVPPFLGYDIMAGTSMAAPQGAGVHALLLSAAQNKGIQVNNGMVRRALKHSASPLPKYGPLDQGGGMVQVGPAWRLLQDLSRSREAQHVLGYETDTPCPTCPHGSAPGSYWRVGEYIPGEDAPLHFSISPIFPTDKSAADRAAFFETYTLRSNVPWLSVNTPVLYAKGEDSMKATVKIRPNTLPKRSATYVGTVTGVAESGPSGRGGATFELQVVVVIPETFDLAKTPSKEWNRQTIEVGDVQRFFVLPPAGATGMTVTMEQVGNTVGSVRLMTSDPQGRQVRMPWSTTASHEKKEVKMHLSPPQFTPGIWEINTYSTFRNRKNLSYDLMVSFHGLQAPDLTIMTLPQGENPTIEGEFVNLNTRVFKGEGRGTLIGYGREDFYDVSGDTLRLPFDVESGMSAAEFLITVSPETYGLFTDVAVTIEDSSGKAVVKGGLGQAKSKVTLSNPAPGSYTLKVEGALTHESPSDWSLSIDETYLYRDQQSLTMSQDGESNLILYPQLPTSLEGVFSGRPRLAPDGYEYRGTLQFKDREKRHTWLAIPLRLTL